MNRRWLLLAGVALALLVTPYLACSSHEDSADASHSEAELKAALLGTWQGSAELDGETVPFALVLDAVVDPRQKVPRISVTGMLASEDPTFNGIVDGHADASSRDAFAIELLLGDGKRLTGNLGSQAFDGKVETAGRGDGTFSLARP